MRIVIFTGLDDIERTPWWRIVLGTPGLEGALVCKKIVSRHPRDVLRRLRGNVRKHGWIFIPYRIAFFVWHALRRVLARPSEPRFPCPLPLEEITALDIHSTETIARVAAWKPDLGVSIGAPVLRASLFRVPRRGTVNLHLGKVPDFRGAPPGFWELEAGATEIGATVHWIDEGLDAGDVIEEATAPIYPADTLARVEQRAAELGVSLLTSALSRLASGENPRRPQPPGGLTRRVPTVMQRARLGFRLVTRRLGRRLENPAYPLKVAAWLASLWLVGPVRDLLRTLRRRHPVRVFTFHRVTNLCRDGMTVSPAVFRRQLAYVRRHHEVVSVERAIALVRAGARLRRPVAALTFDDGYRSVFEQARPVMAELGLTGCCFVSTDLVGTDRRFAHDDSSPVRGWLGVMGWNELAALRDAGWHVGGHSASHPRLAALDGVALRYELESPLALLREHLGITAAPMAYPFGGPDDITPAVAGQVRDSGYTACFSDFGGENFPTGDGYELYRIDLGGDHEALAWKAAAHGIQLSRWKALPERRRAGAPRRAAAPSGKADQRVRVTHIVHDLHGGGMESLVAAMARRYAGTGIAMSAITLQGRPGNVGTSVRHLLDQYHVLKPLPLVSMALPLGLVRRIRATRPDVVHIHSAWYKAALAARLARVARVIYTEHGREHADPPLMQWLDRRAAAWTDVVVPVSGRLNAYLRRGLGVPPERLHTIENGIDTEAFTPGAASAILRAQLGIPEGAVVLGSVGRLEPVKGYDRLIRAFATLRSGGPADPPMFLVLCGDGSERARLEALAAELGIGDAARLPGWTDRPADVYRLLDVFALTSHSEGASVSLMEAMACGCAPVVMDVGANAEILGPALAELVVPADDLEAFSRVVRTVLDSSDRRARCGTLARERVVARYGLDRMVAAYEQLYRAAPARAPEGAPAR